MIKTQMMIANQADSSSTRHDIDIVRHHAGSIQSRHGIIASARLPAAAVLQTLELLEQAAAATGRTVKCGRGVLKAGSAALKRNLSKREPGGYR